MNVNPKERTESIRMRVTPAEKETLKKMAAAAGLTLTGYIIGQAIGDALGQVIIDGFDKKKG